MVDITEIVVAVIGVLSAVVTAFVIPYIRKNTTAAQREDLYDWIQIAVSAAEQIYTKAGQGKVKKQYVLNFLQSKGLTADGDTINMMLESAVYDLTSWGEVDE